MIRYFALAAAVIALTACATEGPDGTIAGVPQPCLQPLYGFHVTVRGELARCKEVHALYNAGKIDEAMDLDRGVSSSGGVQPATGALAQ